MALLPQRTLEQIIGEVLSAIGEGEEGVASIATRSMVEDQVRRAQTLVRQEANWTINRVSVDITLPSGDTSIDWPDDTGPGEIERVSATIATNPKDQWDIIAGITTDDRALWLMGNFPIATYTPYKYDISNGVIELGPASSVDTIIRLDYLLGDDQLVDPGSRPRCDSTAVAMKAEMLVRNIRGGEFRAGIPILMKEYKDYLDRIKPKQGGARRVIQPGSEWDVNDPARRRNLGVQRHWAFRDRRP